ncbi:MAG: flagellar hook assembly protein FlgD [Thermoplasmatota archaeon]
MSHARVIALTLAAVAVFALVPQGALGETPAQPPSFKPAIGGPATVTFFGHVFSSGLDSPMPANTQFPVGEADYGSGLVDSPVECGTGLPQGPVASGPGNTGGTDCDHYTANKLALYSTAGPVQVKNANEFYGNGDYSQLHNENGLTQDIQLDPSGKVTGTIYISHSFHAWPHNENKTPCIGNDPPDNVPCPQPYWRWHDGASYNFQVKAWLYYAVLGDHGANARTKPPIQAAFDSGKMTLIAKGETAPILTVSADDVGGNPRVWKYVVDMGAPLVPVVPNTANLVMIYSWDNVLPNGQEVSSEDWRLNTGENFPPSFTLPTKNPFTVELVYPELVHGKMVFLAVMNTPWGSYDVDPTSVKVEVKDKDGNLVDTPSLRQYGDFSVAHGAHYKPINLTFVWDHQADHLKPGAYSVTVTATNYQHSAGDSRTALFELGTDGTLTRVEPGRAGVQTFSADQFQKFLSGAGQRGNGTADADGSALPSAVPLVTERATNTPLLAVPLAPAVALAAIALAALVARRRIR